MTAAEAVSALIPLLPCTISLIRRGGTSIALAILYCEMPIGSRNSVNRISPGWVGAKSAIGFLLSSGSRRAGRGRRRSAPGEADPPLVVDADAVLAGAVAAQLLQPVAWRHPQVVDALSGIDENKLVVGESAEFRAELVDVAAMPDRLGVLIPERADHPPMVTSRVINAKRYER